MSQDGQLKFFFGLMHRQWLEHPKIPTHDFSNQTIIVTGANVGLGKEAARYFVRLNAATVILACRTTAKGEEAQADIEKTTGRKNVLQVWHLDLSSYDSVKAFAAQCDTLPRIDVLLESAGIATETFARAEAHESTLTTNVISTFLLAFLLLPKLQTTARTFNVTPRLTIVSSDVHALPLFPERHAAPGQIFATLDDQQKADMGARYSLSKLLEVLLIRLLAASPAFPSPTSGTDGPTPPVILNTVNPGLCHSGLLRERGTVGIIFKTLLHARSTEKGSRTLVLATGAGPESHGAYMSGGVVTEPSGWTRSAEGKETGEKVWAELRPMLEAIQPGVTGKW
jgi:retinol dehydrogenase 12